jgi:hypothetical protein
MGELDRERDTYQIGCLPDGAAIQFGESQLNGNIYYQIGGRRNSTKLEFTILDNNLVIFTVLGDKRTRWEVNLLECVMLS